MKVWESEADWDNSQSTDNIIDHSDNGEYPASVVEPIPQRVEVGIVEIPNTIQMGVTKTIELKREYESPVVVTQVNTDNDPEGDKVGSGVKNVTPQSFEIYMDYPKAGYSPNPPVDGGEIVGNARSDLIEDPSHVEDSGSVMIGETYEPQVEPVGKHVPEKVAYMVVEEGGYRFNGLKLSAMKIEHRTSPYRDDTIGAYGFPEVDYGYNPPALITTNQTRRNGVNISTFGAENFPPGGGPRDFEDRDFEHGSYIEPYFVNSSGYGRKSQSEEFAVVTLNRNESSYQLESHLFGGFTGTKTFTFENNYDKPPLVFTSQTGDPNGYENLRVDRNDVGATLKGGLGSNISVIVVSQDFSVINEDSHRTDIRGTLKTVKK